jgi:hypothetical protein
MTRFYEDDFIEVFATSDRAEADIVRDEVLAPNGVSAVIRDRSSHPFNTSSMSGAFYVAVPREEAQSALDLLADARSIGVFGG